MVDVWPAVHAERKALITFLSTLDDNQWEVPSLCEGWTVHDVVAHLVDVAKTTPMSFVVSFAKARFDIDRENDHGIAREKGDSPAETLSRFREAVYRKSSPPAPRTTRLIEAFVHGEDIRRPLGTSGDYPVPALEQSLEYLVKTSVNFGGGKEYAADLTLAATDTDTVIGSGPAVHGPVLSLLMAASGRIAALDELEGPGQAKLASRLEASQ